MRLPPPSVVASWPTPNYTDPVTRGPLLLILNIILISLVTVAVVGRLYSRLYIKRWFGWDDAMIIPAFIFDVGLTACVLLANFQYGWDRHIWDLPFDMYPPAQKIAFAAKILFTVAATGIRLSLICFYYRLVKDSGLRWFYWVLHVSFAWTMAVCISFIILTIWLCSPIQAYWVFPPIGYCLSEGKVMLGGGVVNSLTDLWVTFLPIPVVMRLQMPLRQRIGVCILLCMGVIVTAAGSVRTYYTWKSLLEDWDETWWAYWLWVAAAIEIHLGMICACAPAWKSLLQAPIQSLSGKISSKLTSIRTPSHSPNSSSSAKRFIFNPLRSLPWFLHTRFDFERTQADPSERDLQGPEKEPPRNGILRTREVTQFQQYCDPVDSSAPPKDDMSITMRRSVEQSSTHVRESPVVPREWVRQDVSDDTTATRDVEGLL